MVNHFIEGNAGVGWAMRDVKLAAQVAFEEVQEQQVDAHGRGLTGVDGHLEKRLNDAFVVN